MENYAESHHGFHSRNDDPQAHLPTTDRELTEFNVSNAHQNARHKGKNVYESFMKTILEFNKKRGTPMSEQPHIDGRSINLYALYGYVLKAGGSEVVHQRKLWSSISNSLGFSGHEGAIAEIHKRCLREYEKEWLAKRKGTQYLPLEGSKSSTQGANLAQRGSEHPIQETSERSFSSDNPMDQSTEQYPPIATDHEDTLYRPLKRRLDTFAGLDPKSVTLAAKDISRMRPYPTFQELGRLDIQALSRSLQSTLPAETGHALDVLVIIAGDRRWGLPLVHCADLLESLLDCLNNGLALFERQTATRDMETYDEVAAAVRLSSGRLRAITSEVGTHDFRRAVAVQQSMSVLTVLRNLAFTEVNQETIATVAGLPQVLASSVRVFCNPGNERHVTRLTELNFRKDLITLLSLIGHHMVIVEQDTADALIKFILSFAPTPDHAVLGVASYDPSSEPYLAPATDALAKIISRDIPNRQVCTRSMLLRSGEGLLLLNRMMALAVAVTPTTLEPGFLQTLPRRVPLLHHALIVAETAANLSGFAKDLAKKWMEENAVFTRRLVNLLRILTTTAGQQSAALAQDIRVIVRRLNTILSVLNNETRPNRSMRQLTRAEKAVIFYESGVDL